MDLADRAPGVVPSALLERLNSLEAELVTRIADTGLAFGGSWTFALQPAASGTRLSITENGEVYNPLFRVMSRFVFGHTATIDRYLGDLQKHLR